MYEEKIFLLKLYKIIFAFEISNFFKFIILWKIA